MTRLLLLTLLISPFSTHLPSILPASVSQTSTGGDWQRMLLRDEDFSVLVPTQPSLLIHSARYSLSDGGEKILDHRAYSAYVDGFIFVIESYRASRPQKLLKDVHRRFRNFGRIQLDSSTETNFSGVNASKYAIGRDNFTGFAYVFAARQHVYAVTVAAKTPGHPSITRFLSSFTLEQNGLAGTVAPKNQDDSVDTASASGILVRSRDTNPKAIVVWKPEPDYTEAARSNQQTGTVVLMGTFTSSGEVIITNVIKPLRDGLTEKAIAAAKNIKFFPAEKDGKLVSVSLELQYNFNLY